MKAMRPLLLAALAASPWWLAMPGCAPDRDAPRPDVLWICVDVLRADRLGCYGYERPTSPRIDRLAREGARFQNAFSQSSWTKPSVPSLFTSLYPMQHGVYEGSTKHGGAFRSDVLAPELTTAAEVFRDSGYATAAFVRNAQLRSYLGFDQGFDVYRDETAPASEINDHAREWIESADRPFFCYVHYLDVHWPYRPERRWLEAFRAPRTDLDLTGPGAPRLQDRINDGEVELGAEDAAAIEAHYDACVRQTDAAIGELLDWLDGSGLARDTIVVVCSDHGEELLEHGTIGHGRSLRDTLIRVPLIFRGPGIRPGIEPDAVALNIDVLPTLCELASVPAPPACAGRSLARVLRDPAADLPDRPAFSETLRSKAYYRSVRMGGFKLVEKVARPGGSTVEARREGRLAVEPGVRVSVRGAFEGDRFVASRLSLPSGRDTDIEVRGPLRWIDRDRAVLEVAGFAVDAIDAEVESRATGREIELHSLSEGEVADVDGVLAGALRLKARKIERREDKGASNRIKLEGPAEQVDEIAPGLRVAGVEVVFEDDVELPGMRLVEPEGADAPRDPRAWFDGDVEVSLFDLRRDPNETRDVSAEHPDVVARLRDELGRWAASLERPLRTARTHELDGHALEELRQTGYVR